MADPNTRQGKRTPVTLKIKFKSETLEQFIERYAVDVSQGGIFIRTKEPLAVGTQMRFEFQLRDASPLIAGEGTVVWTRENDPSRPAIAPGMGVRFDRLAEGSQAVLERILNEKAKQAPARPPTESTKPPLFTDTPTRVAPMSVQDALLGNETPTRSQAPLKRGDDFNESTPLPRPMPFHGDQDDFDAGAFDEATKVRALDELIAQTAPDSTVSDLSTSSVAAQEAQAAKTAEKPPERESAPTLPSPPESPRASQKMATVPPATTSASAASTADSASEDAGPTTSGTDAAASAATASSAARTSSPDVRTKIGVEPAKAPTKTSTATPSQPTPTVGTASKDTGKAAARTASATEPVKRPEAKSSGGPGAAIAVLLLVAVAVGAVWFFVLRKKENTGTTGGGEIASGGSETASGSDTQPSIGSGSDVAQNAMTGSESGSNDVGSGSNVAMTGSNDVGSGSAPAPVPAAALVDTVIAADAKKAMIEVAGGPSGPAPLKAKLEKDRVYKVRVTAPGYAEMSMDVKGGEPKAMAKLTMKPRVVSVTSEPAGAAIFVNNAATGKVTPADIELTRAQATRPSVRVSLRKTGFKAVENTLTAAKWTEGAAKVTASVDAKLVVQQIVRPPPPPPPPTGTGSGSAPPPTGEGSGAPTPTGEGSGAAPTPTPTPTPPAPPPPSGGGGGEPTEADLN